MLWFLVFVGILRLKHAILESELYVCTCLSSCLRKHMAPKPFVFASYFIHIRVSL
jgi:hypothetical protein